MDKRSARHDAATDAEACGKVVRLFEAVPPSPAAPLRDRERAMLASLRALFVASVLKPRGDFDRACLLIAGDRETSVERYATAFFHGLESFARRPLAFHSCSSESPSSDEMWMMRLLETLARGDASSARYLLATRIEHLGRRRMLFLAQGLAKSLVGSDDDNDLASSP
ncbi:MAG: hypothetical protein NW215_08300 [Hyphomicrobiales bacterium]|nr:hypothetical protein [Hyphomicrobiales bacterium]